MLLTHLTTLSLPLLIAAEAPQDHLTTLLNTRSPSPLIHHHNISKRVDVSWGPIYYLGPSKSSIISAVTTSYPGNMPPNQAGGLYLWPGITSPATPAYLVQSVMGSYPEGLSECGPNDGREFWCITSEVYGPEATNQNAQTQYVGDLKTIDKTPEGGLVFNYTLVDDATYTWNQTVHDATTGVLMSTYQSRVGGPMQTWNVAVECQSCTPTISPQTYKHTTIVLDEADETFGSKLSTSGGATYSNITSPDGGKTWVVELITLPAMDG